MPTIIPYSLIPIPLDDASSPSNVTVPISCSCGTHGSVQGMGVVLVLNDLFIFFFLLYNSYIFYFVVFCVSSFITFEKCLQIYKLVSSIRRTLLHCSHFCHFRFPTLLHNIFTLFFSLSFHFSAIFYIRLAMLLLFPEEHTHSKWW